ncbi:MAG TPA: hypothetical protein VNY73_03355 [Bacteroidia bacterium]|jgi:hypothetical protein|nr:hypothetical protein [Bacteroidia bacterium]
MNFTNSLLFARKKLEQLNQYISLLPFIYVAALLLLYFLFYFLGIVTQLPYADRLVGFDAVIYNSIREKGYDYQWYTGNNAGFFPLFPYVWRWLCLGTKGICLLNFLCFCTGLALLIKEFKPAPILVLCFISVPSAIFRFLPFTESFFFLFCSIFLVGLSKNKPWLIITGLLLSSLTRPTAMFFIPAIIAAEVFYDERFFSWKAIKNILCYSAASLTGLFTVVLIQYYQTYEWFAFAKLQTKYWRHHFSLPQLPFTTNGGDKLLWLDGLAFFVSILATSILLFYFIKYCFRKTTSLHKNRAFWFSCTYLFMVLLYTIFFDPKAPHGGTELNSMNRYVFTTSFFLVFCFVANTYFSFSYKNFLSYLGVAFLVWILLGFGRPLAFLSEMFQSQHKTTVFFTYLTLYVMAYFFVFKSKYQGYFSIILICFNIMLSAYVFNLYLNGKWVA